MRYKIFQVLYVSLAVLFDLAAIASGDLQIQLILVIAAVMELKTLVSNVISLLKQILLSLVVQIVWL